MWLTEIGYRLQTWEKITKKFEFDVGAGYFFYILLNANKF
jgi:hypothetical protein